MTLGLADHSFAPVPLHSRPEQAISPAAGIFQQTLRANPWYFLKMSKSDFLSVFEILY
jgi:hypothetical protein